MSYDLSDPLQVRRLLADAAFRIEKTGLIGSTACAVALTTFANAIEAGPVELIVYKDRNLNVALRVKRKGRKTTEGNSIEARFNRYHEANPQIYDAIVRRLSALSDQGIERTSIKAAIEALRYSSVSTNRTETDKAFKIPNDFASRYARLIAEKEPDLGRMLLIKKLSSL